MRGRFINGIWHCNCDPRLPAAFFETKKQGVNQGKWCKWIWQMTLLSILTEQAVYTCQKPQNERCNFFLWAEEAEAREKFIVLSNARSEPESDKTPKTPKTPSKTVLTGNGLLTPATGRGGRYRDALEDDVESPSKSQRSSKTISGDEDSFGWDDDLDDEVEQLLDRPPPPPPQPNFCPETPRKTPRAATITSSRKRKLEEIEDNDGAAAAQATPRAASQRTPLLTPSSRHSSQMDSFPPSSVEISKTPTPSRYTNVLSAHSHSDNSELATTALALLDRHDVVLPRKAKDELVALLNRHELRTQGIVRGRDITRLALKKKEEQIKELNERIKGLEAQREMDRAVIDGLKECQRSSV